MEQFIAIIRRGMAKALISLGFGWNGRLLPVGSTVAMPDTARRRLGDGRSAIVMSKRE